MISAPFHNPIACINKRLRENVAQICTIADKRSGRYRAAENDVAVEFGKIGLEIGIKLSGTDRANGNRRSLKSRCSNFSRSCALSIRSRNDRLVRRKLLKAVNSVIEPDP